MRSILILKLNKYGGFDASANTLQSVLHDRGGFFYCLQIGVEKYV